MQFIDKNRPFQLKISVKDQDRENLATITPRVRDIADGAVVQPETMKSQFGIAKR